MELAVTVVLGVLALGASIYGFIQLYEWWQKRRKPPTTPVPPGPKPPRRPEPRFIDRHDREGRDLLKQVSEALGANGLVTVWGAGGVGKTTLAIEVAHCLCPKPYSGGVIWDSADGRTDFALVTVLDKILTDLGREEARTLIPDAKADLADRLLTEAMPCLLGLDNFETIAEEEQTVIIGFLNELSCPVLVTSRERLHIGQNIRTGPMTPDESRDFLELRIEQSSQPDKLREMDLNKMAEVAEYNPMLMRWVVAQLEQAMRPEDVFDDIARGRGKTIDRIFGRTFRLLEDDGQTALLALALFVPTASREALTGVCGFEDGRDRVNEAIRRLAAFDLLDTAVDDDRLGIVALTRRLTEAQLQRDEHTEGLKERFIAYFLAYAEAHPEVTKEDLDALDDERKNLLGALDYAYAVEGWESVMGLRGTLEEFLDLRGYWDEAIKWGERAAEAARRAHDDKALAIFTHNTGVIYEKRGRYDEAKDLYNQSLEIARTLDDQPRIASSLHQLGVIALLQGDYEEGKDLINRSLELARNLGDQARIAICLHNLGIIAQDQGDYQESKDLYNQSLQTLHDLGAEKEQARIASCLHRLGTIAQVEGDYRKAKTLYNQSLEIARTLDDPAGKAKCLHQLSMIAQDQGDYQEAKDLCNQSLEIARTLDDQVGIAKCLHQLGLAAQAQGQYQEAKNLHNQSLEIARTIGDPGGIAISLGQLGSLSEERDQVEEAAQFYAEALTIFEKLGSPYANIARESLTRVTGKKTKE